MKTFGENLKRIRKSQYLTQEQLGSMADIAQTAISHFEIGARQPSLQDIRKICIGLHCWPNDLITF